MKVRKQGGIDKRREGGRNGRRKEWRVREKDKEREARERAHHQVM